MARVEIHLIGNDGTSKVFQAVERNAVSAFNNIKTASRAYKKETPVTETYELSKAFKQLGVSIGSLSFVPIIGDFAATGFMVAHAAGSVKSFTSALKTFAKVSISALGPWGMAGLAAAAAGAGYLLGNVIDSWVYKLTRIDLSGMNKVRELTEDIAEQQKAMGSQIEKNMTAMARLGIGGATEKERRANMSAAIRNKQIIYDPEQNKWVTASVVARQKAEEALKQTEKERLQVQEQLKSSYIELEAVSVAALERIKSKTQELLNVEKEIRQQNMTTEDLVLAVRQKTMTETEKYYSTYDNLLKKYNLAMSLGGDEKIQILQSIQREMVNMSNEVIEDGQVIISLYDAQQFALENIRTIGEAITEEQERKKASIQDEIRIWEEVRAAAQSSLDQIRYSIDTLPSTKRLDIDASGAFATIARLRAELASLGFSSTITGGGLQSENSMAGVHPLGEYATGTSYVPRTGPYILHEGEAVIPANQNTFNNRSSTVNNFNFYGSPTENAKEVEKVLIRRSLYGRSRLAGALS